MARILVAGGLYPREEDQKLHDKLRNFSKSLGRELIARGHIVLGGCRTALDTAVACAAEEKAIEMHLDPKKISDLG